MKKKKILSLIACLSLLSSCNKKTSSNSLCSITTSTPTSTVSPDVEPSIEELNNELFENYAIFTNNSADTIDLSGFKSEMPERLLNLESIIIPENLNGKLVVGINISNNYTFGNFKNLRFIKIPSTIVNISTFDNSSNSSPFVRLPYLENIEVDSNNEQYLSKGNCLINKTDNSIICGWGDVEIPDEITTIRNYCFYNNYSITSIKLNDNINSISSYSFKGLTQLNEIDVKGNPKYTVEGNTFFSNNNNTVYAAWGHVDYPIRMRTLDISNNPSVTSISLANGVLSRIAQWGLRGTSIEEIEIPPSLTSIPTYAFAGATKLKKITIKNNEKYACSNNCVYEISTKNVIGGCSDVIIPEGITEITESSFASCSSITSIHFPSSITSIENTGGQFSGLNGLKLKLSISENNSNYKVENNCLMKVEGSDNIVINALPNNDTGDIVLPNSATIFQSASFDNESLYAKSIKFNDGLKEIRLVSSNRGLFNSAYNQVITEIELPLSLEKIEISDSGISPFSGLTNLEKLTFRGNKLNNDYFKIDGNCLITKGNNEDYSDGKIIFGFNDVIIPSYINTLPDNLFSENYSITSLTLHKNITSLGTSSLKKMRSSYGYGAIKEFNYPGTLTEFKTKISNNTSFYDLLKQSVYSNVLLNYKDENGKDVSIKMSSVI